jgi:hypothetical protein
MRGKELFDRLVRQAWRRYERVLTRRSFRDWADQEKLVDSADPRLQRIYRQTLTICRLFARGAENFHDVRIELWLGGLIDRIRDFRSSVRTHYRQLMTRALRPVVTDRGPENEDVKRARRYKWLLRRLGNASPLLASVSQAITDDQMIAAYDSARFGPEDAMRAHKNEDLSIAGCLEKLGFPRWLLSSLPESSNSFVSAYSGFALFPVKGDRYRQIEGSADATVQRLKSSIFINARDVVRIFPWTFKYVPHFVAAIAPENKERLQLLRPAFLAAALAVQRNPWRLALFVMMVRWLSHDEDGGWWFARAARLMIPPLQKLIAYSQNDPRVFELMNDDNPFAFIAYLNRRTIEKESGKSFAVIPERTFCQVARLLLPHGLRELHRMTRPYRSRIKPCLSA